MCARECGGGCVRSVLGEACASALGLVRSLVLSVAQYSYSATTVVLPSSVL